MNCPVCGGSLIEGAANEHGFQCDTCSFPYQEDKDEKGEDE